MRTSTIQLFEDRPNVKLTTYLYDPDLEMIGKVKRPGMYIGSVSTKGLNHLIYEIVDNSVDERLTRMCQELALLSII